MTVAERRRLDQELVARGLAASRERAQALVRAGLVRLEGQLVSRPDQPVGHQQQLEIAGVQEYVSRGAEKLEAALASFAIEVTGRICLDVGASTGGFTEVLLRRGAARVIAVDVGYGQLAWALRQDPRVVVMERTNIRHLEQLPLAADLAAIDVSFISLRLVLPRMAELLNPPGEVVALVKPQFEVGKGSLGKGGVVRDPAQHQLVLDELTEFARRLGYQVNGPIPSPLLGAKGNREFFLHLLPHG
jgi:23S rRNA (cytidine1920-2'-O)/16S rRNA (cytidine1409-2'-O)-methyltransferase